MKKRQNSESIIRDIKRKTRKRYNSEEKIRVVLEGLRGESTVAELCRKVRNKPKCILQVEQGVFGSRKEKT